MRTVIGGFTACMLLQILSGCALPSEATHPRSRDYNKVAASGAPKRLEFAASVNDDCSDKGRPTIRLVEAPQHGKVQIAPAMEFPLFPWGDVRTACNQRRIAGMSAHYTSRAGFVGTDFVAIEVIFVEGRVVQHGFNINVR